MLEPVEIIPISKLLGNYNTLTLLNSMLLIIPISKLLGNYNSSYYFVKLILLYQYLNC